MRRFLLLFLLALAGCSATERITKEYTETIDTVRVPVYSHPVEYRESVMLEDTVRLDLPRLNLSIIRLPDTTSSGADSLQVDATVKADTLEAECLERTITKTETIVEERRVMAWWGWVAIGALVILLVAALLR